MLLAGLRHDPIGAEELLDGLDFEALIADKAHDSDTLRAKVSAGGVRVVIPPRCNRVSQIDSDMEMYKWRRMVENFFWASLIIRISHLV